MSAWLPGRAIDVRPPIFPVEVRHHLTAGVSDGLQHYRNDERAGSAGVPPTTIEVAIASRANSSAAALKPDALSGWRRVRIDESRSADPI